MRAFVRSVDAERFDGDLTVVRAGAVAALASPAIAAPRRSVDKIRDHERIAMRVHARTASLPARFGMHYADGDALASALVEKQDALARALDDVGDRVELALVLLWRAVASQSDATTGREYLARSSARVDVERRAEALVARLVEYLGCERALTRQSIGPRDGVAATMALLTERGEENTIRERAAGFEQENDAVRVEVYGPMPPYSFVS